MSTHEQDRIVVATSDVSRRSVVVGMGFAGIAAAFTAAGWRVRAVAQDATPATGEPAADLNALEVIYYQPEDPAAFEDYLFNTHLPIVWEVPGIQEVIVHSAIVGVDGAPGEIYQIGTVLWESQAEMEAALASAEGQAAITDVANFATGGFSAYLARVDVLTPPDGAATPAT